MDGTMYRYKGCGLENIFLVNGFAVRKLRNGSEIVAIEDVEGLHRAIALNIVESGRPLDGRTFRFLRKELDMAQRQVASMLGVEEQTVSLWERERKSVPQHADLMLRALTKETLSGHAELKALIERFNSLDREARALEEKIEFMREADDGWIRQCAA